MELKIAVLAGDGIGPEISAVGVDVLTAVCEKFGHKVRYEYAICGADAIDKVGDPFPEETYQICKDSDAVLFSAVGDPSGACCTRALCGQTSWKARISFASAS